MPRRLLAILTAVLLAGLGTFALVHYVRGAEDRALAGEQLTQVYVVRSPISAGTAAADLGGLVEAVQVPVKVRAADAVTDLAVVADKVTAVDLVPGEQLLLARMVQPEDQLTGTAGGVPPGLVEVTLELSPTRAVGGQVQPGDTVAVLSSFEPFDLSGAVVEVDGDDIPVPGGTTVGISGRTPNTTHVIAQQVLVTAVQSAGPPPGEENAQQVPSGDLLVTLAVTPADAERVVFTAEFGTIWLAAETGEFVPGGTGVQSRGTVYETTGGIAP